MNSADKTTISVKVVAATQMEKTQSLNLYTEKKISIQPQKQDHLPKGQCLQDDPAPITALPKGKCLLDEPISKPKKVTKYKTLCVLRQDSHQNLVYLTIGPPYSPNQSK
jgi:hypothetical protein